MRFYDSSLSSQSEIVRRFKPCVTIVMLFALLSCGSEEQDKGSVDSVENLSGVAIDPYLINATVYIDTNANGMIDSWEPRALTDENGYFSVSMDGVDYCADSEEEEFKYCLQSSVDTASGLIRVIGGYDSVTEEPFSGELSVRVENLGSGAVINNVITPLTTIVAVAETDEDVEKQLSLLGITSSDLGVDYLSGTVRTDLLTATEKIVRAIGLVANLFDSYYDELGEDENLPTNSAGIVFNNITPLLSENSNLDINSVFSESVLRGILEGTENDIVNLYTEAELDLPGVKITSEEGESLFADKLAHMYDRLAQILTMVDDIYSSRVFDSPEEAFATVRIVEVVQQRMINEDSAAPDGDIDLLVDLATDAENANNEQLFEQLARNDVDISALVETDFSSEAEVLNVVNYDSEVTPFELLPGKKLLVNDPDNFTTRKKHARAELYFMGDQGATQGSLAMCIKSLSGDAAVGSNVNSRNDDLLESGDSYGRYSEAAKGRWRILNSGYSVLIEIDFAGGTYSAILKKGAPIGEGDQHRYVYRFDLDDDLERWSSVEGLVLQDGTEPASDSVCKQRFIDVVE